MTSDPGPGKGRSKKAHRPEKTEDPLPIRAIPAVLLEARTREWIDRLEAEIERQRAELAYLRHEIGRLGPENARLSAQLEMAEQWNVAATVLVSLGGALLGYSGFAEPHARVVASFGAAFNISGIFLMFRGIRKGRNRV